MKFSPSIYANDWLCVSMPSQLDKPAKDHLAIVPIHADTLSMPAM